MINEPALLELKNIIKDAHINLAVGADIHDDKVLQRVQLHKELVEEFRNYATKCLSNMLQSEFLKDYDPGHKPDRHELVRLKVKDLKNINSLIKNIMDIDDIELFKADDRIIDNLKFYSVIISQRKNENAIFFRVFSPKKELTRGNKLAAIVLKGVFRKVKEKVFLFDKSFDCVVWKDYIYILHYGNFQKIFNYFEVILTQAENAMGLIEHNVPISNFDKFKHVCMDNMLMASKLASIAKKPYIKRIKIKDIKRTIKEFELDVKIEEEDSIEKLIFDPSPRRRWLILKLLDDDYLGSIMTNEKYEVNSKSSLH